MDILTLELFDVTVSEALREINRVLETHPGVALRILLGSDRMLQHNIQRFLDRLGRSAVLRPDGSAWRFEVAGSVPAGYQPLAVASPRPAVISADAAGASVHVAGAPGPAAAAPAPAPAPGAKVRPLLITCSRLGQGSQDIGRRLLLGVLRELDPAVPWVGLALDGIGLLDDPEARRLLEGLQARGTPVRISRESQLFPLEGEFEAMEDSRWQRLAGRGEITLL
jgi:hypothetical protein